MAKDAGKAVDGLVDVLVAATTKKLDEAGADGRLTKARRDEIVAGLNERTAAIVNRTAPPKGMPFRGHHGGHGFPGGPPGDDG